MVQFSPEEWQLIEKCIGEFASEWRTWKRDQPFPEIQAESVCLSGPAHEYLYEKLLHIDARQRSEHIEDWLAEEYGQCSWFHPSYLTAVREGIADAARNHAATIEKDAAPIYKPADSEEQEIGTSRKIGSNICVEELGSGGNGTVYRAYQLPTHRPVAVKLMHFRTYLSEQGRRRFEREVQAMSRLEHRGIVRLYEADLEGEQPHITMELIAGNSLARQVKEKQLPWKTACRLAIDVACALHFAHEQGILHRDISTSNILIREDGSPCLSDFGLAKIEDIKDSITKTDETFGTWDYAAPELLKAPDRHSKASDIYALGIVLFKCLGGSKAFPAQWSELEWRREHDGAPTSLRSFCDCPNELEYIVAKCCRLEPAARYASAADLANDLERLLSNRPIRARRVSSADRLQMLIKRHPIVFGLTGGIIALLAVLLVFGYVSLREQSRQRAAAERNADRALAVSETLLRAIDELSLDTVAELKHVGDSEAIARRLSKVTLEILGRLRTELPEDPRGLRVQAVAQMTQAEVELRAGLLFEALASARSATQSLQPRGQSEQRLTDTRLAAEIASVESLILREQGDLNTAERILTQAISDAEEIDKAEGSNASAMLLIRLLDNLSDIERDRQDTPRQIEILSRAIPYIERIQEMETLPERQGTWLTMEKLAEAQLILGQSEAPLRSLLHLAALRRELYESAPDDPELGTALIANYITLTRGYLSTSRIAEAEDTIRFAINTAREVSRKSPQSRMIQNKLAVCLDTQGMVLTAASRYQEAIQSYQEEIQLRSTARSANESVDDRFDLAIAYLHLGEAYWNNVRPQSAADAWNSGSEILSSTGQRGAPFAGDFQAYADKLARVSELVASGTVTQPYPGADVLACAIASALAVKQPATCRHFVERASQSNWSPVESYGFACSLSLLIDRLIEQECDELKQPFLQIAMQCIERAAGNGLFDDSSVRNVLDNDPSLEQVRSSIEFKTWRERLKPITSLQQPE